MDKGGGKGHRGIRKGGSAPAFQRQIPKFLQQYAHLIGTDSDKKQKLWSSKRGDEDEAPTIVTSEKLTETLKEEKDMMDDAAKVALEEYNLKRKANVDLEDLVDAHDMTRESKRSKTDGTLGDPDKIRELSSALSKRHDGISLTKEEAARRAMLQKETAMAEAARREEAEIFAKEREAKIAAAEKKGSVAYIKPVKAAKAGRSANLTHAVKAVKNKKLLSFDEDDGK